MFFDSQIQTKPGAEAFIRMVDWQGKPAVSKTRVPKVYRNPSLDFKLRTSRTKGESELLHFAKLAGVNAPELYIVDPFSNEIVMEYIKGTMLKDIEGARRMRSIYREVGEIAAKLHLKGIIHGDLTPKNIIQSESKLVVIDFGLSFVSNRLEDRAEDLHLLKQAMRSSQSKTSHHLFDWVLKGYGSVLGNEECKKIAKQIVEIERRGRYARVD